MSKEASIYCPNCAEQIDVNEILYHQLENEFKQKKLEDEIAQKRVEYKQALDLLKQKEENKTDKRFMNHIWKQIEKQIEKVLDNTIGMYGSIKGIAGNSIGNVKALELPHSAIEE